MLVLTTKLISTDLLGVVLDRMPGLEDHVFTLIESEWHRFPRQLRNTGNHRSDHLGSISYMKQYMNNSHHSKCFTTTATAWGFGRWAAFSSLILAAGKPYNNCGNILSGRWYEIFLNCTHKRASDSKPLFLLLLYNRSHRSEVNMKPEKVMDGRRKENMYSEAVIHHSFDKQNRQGRYTDKS